MRWCEGEEGQKIEMDIERRAGGIRNFGWNCINFQSGSKPKINDQTHKFREGNKKTFKLMSRSSMWRRAGINALNYVICS